MAVEVESRYMPAPEQLGLNYNPRDPTPGSIGIAISFFGSRYTKQQVPVSFTYTVGFLPQPKLAVPCVAPVLGPPSHSSSQGRTWLRPSTTYDDKRTGGGNVRAHLPCGVIGSTNEPAWPLLAV